MSWASGAPKGCENESSRLGQPLHQEQLHRHTYWGLDLGLLCHKHGTTPSSLQPHGKILLQAYWEHNLCSHDDVWCVKEKGLSNFNTALIRGKLHVSLLSK